MAARISQGSPRSERWNSAASPAKLPAMVSGMPISASAARIAAMASPSEAPGARSKPRVTAGNWLCLVTVSGPGPRPIRGELGQRHLRRAGRRLHRRALRRRRLAGGGRHPQQGDHARVVAQLGRGFQHHAVLVVLGIDRADLPLAEGIVQHVVDRLHGDAEPAGLVAVHIDRHPQPAVALVGGDVAQDRQRHQPCVPGIGAQWPSSTGSGSISVYWKAVLPGRAPIWMSCTGWRVDGDARQRIEAAAASAR